MSARQPPTLRPFVASAVGFVALLLTGCRDEAKDGPRDAAVDAAIAAGDAGVTSLPFTLPPGFPVPRVPASNPLTKEKVELGRHLFYDKRLSANGAQSCGSCHEQARAFTDGRARALGSTGQDHPRNSMSLANVAYASTLTWANPNLTALETQAAVPLFGVDPIVELGLRGHEEMSLDRLRAEPKYPPLFGAAFPGEAQPFTMENVQRALASFQRALVSGNSPFDRFRYRGQPDALTKEQRRGFELFSSETLECFHCHGGFNFTDSVAHGNLPPEPNFHNTGLYNIDGRGGFPRESQGLLDFTGRAEDMGKFKAPTLRNVAKTAPYMHDGSIATLVEVVEHYAQGGRTISSGPNAGVGSANPHKSGFITGFNISEEDKRALVAFLESLTDEEFLTDPRLADPWAAQPRDAGAPPRPDAGTADAAPFVCASRAPSACEEPAPVWANIEPIIEQRCVVCHNGASPTGPWPLRGYKHVTDWEDTIRAAMLDCVMPPRDSGMTMPDTERAAILMWIRCGMRP